MPVQSKGRFASFESPLLCRDKPHPKYVTGPLSQSRHSPRSVSREQSSLQRRQVVFICMRVQPTGFEPAHPTISEWCLTRLGATTAHGARETCTPVPSSGGSADSCYLMSPQAPWARFELASRFDTRPVFQTGERPDCSTDGS